MEADIDMPVIWTNFQTADLFIADRREPVYLPRDCLKGLVNHMASAASISCAESIAFLYLLHPVPAQPCTNAFETPPCPSRHHTLPLERERTLTSILAFLASISEDTHHIPAICVQEDSENRSLKVLIAVNEATWGDGRRTLDALEHGFGTIFSMLSLASPTEEGDVFAAIVHMCSKRILHRMRISGRNRPKQSLKTLLVATLQSLTTAPLIFVEKTKRLVRLLDSWEKHQTPVRLQNVVQGVYEVSHMAAVLESIQSIPNRKMDPSSRDSLLNMIKKVARYRSSARFLYRTAKRFPLAQAMKAIPVALPKVAFQIQKCDQIYSLDSYLRRIGTFHGKGKNLGQFCRLLQTSEQQAGDEFVKQSKKTLLEAKIHAEIQLIFHCEREKYIPFPRVISSSKDACFLCNAFIHMHGKFHTPRSHGRLYPGWRLPMLPEAAIFEQRFVQYLQSYARDSIKVVLSRRKKTTYPNPNESTVLTIPNTPSSLSCGCSSSKYSDIAVNQMPAMVSAPVVPQAIDADGGDSQFAFDDGCQCSQKQTCSAPSSNGRRSAVSSSKTMAECSTGKGTCIKPKHGSISHGEREEPVNQLPIRLTGENLPFSRKITIHQQSFELACGNVMFLLEFDAVQAGRVSITKQKQDASDMRTSAAINVLDIPTNSEIKVECSRGASRFLVLLSPSVLLSFEFVWNAEEAIDMK